MIAWLSRWADAEIKSRLAQLQLQLDKAKAENTVLQAQNRFLSAVVADQVAIVESHTQSIDPLYQARNE